MPGQRALAREATVQAIKTEARRQLARDGAAALSLRSVARELDMVSSALYRYVASRDELLTLLIVDGYNSLADTLETTPRSSSGQSQWRALCRAVRRWAIDHRHEYSLLYGSPVPRYSAPEDTIPPATRVYRALLQPCGRERKASPTSRTLPASVRTDAQRVADTLELDAPPDRVAAALGAIASVFGLVSFELFGHTKGVITDNEAFFVLHVDALATELGL